MRPLSWKSHLIELSRRHASSVGILYKLRHYVPPDTLISIYYALFYPFLTYGIVVWGATYENLLKLVLTAQKKVIRAITFSEPTAHSSPIFRISRYLSLVIYINFIFPHLFFNVIMTLLLLISETFSDLFPQFILILLEVLLVVIFPCEKEHATIYVRLL